MSVSLIDGHIDDDEMKDEQIIKALEHCVTDLDCLQCPYVDYDGKERCDEKLLNDLCDLINRKNAKIKALQMDNEQLATDNFNANMNCEHLQAEIERLSVPKELIDDDFCGVVCEFAEELIEKAKAEAVKEFAERLCDGRVSNDPVVIATKCLLKEMVGEASG